MAIPKSGELLRGYKLSGDFRIVGGGTCQWTFASKDGGDFFVKMFLDPRMPSAASPGSEAVKNQRRERCHAFERHQRDLMERVRKLVGPGGNLVAPIDFFEHEGYYFKVARKVTVTPGAEKDIHTRPIQDRITLCVNVSSALQSLHTNSIVHGDLKLDNILLQKGADGGYLAKVIDFDSSYVVGAPPSTEEILGDPPYYSPELLDYIQGIGSVDNLTTASDIFSLGIVFCEYLTGVKPTWTGTHNYLSEAVRAGATISIADVPNDDGRKERLVDLVSRMIDLNPAERPSLLSLKVELMAIRDGSTGGTPAPPILLTPTKPPTDPEPSTPSTPTSVGTPELDIETLAQDVHKSVDALVAKAAVGTETSAKPTSKLRGTGIASLAPSPPSADNSAAISALAEALNIIRKALGT